MSVNEQRETLLFSQEATCVLTAGAAGEAAVVVQAAHGLAGLAGSVHLLVALDAGSWKKRGSTAFREDRGKPLTVRQYI